MTSSLHASDPMGISRAIQKIHNQTISVMRLVIDHRKGGNIPLGPVLESYIGALNFGGENHQCKGFSTFIIYSSDS